ncbi:MAG: hypothetical protein ACLTAI_05200 [Thomasclavelia sp.]
MNFDKKTTVNLLKGSDELVIAVKIDNISKSYDNHNIFDNFSLEINKGEFVIISGKSGSREIYFM